MYRVYCLDSLFKLFKRAPSALCCPLPASDPENLKGVIIIMPSVDRTMLYLISHLNIWLCMKMLVYRRKRHADGEHRSILKCRKSLEVTCLFENVTDRQKEQNMGFREPSSDKTTLAWTPDTTSTPSLVSSDRWKMSTWQTFLSSVVSLPWINITQKLWKHSSVSVEGAPVKS